MILAVSTAALFLDQLGWLHRFETAALDTFINLKAPSVSRHVTLVTVDDADYRALFRETSPLDPIGLRQILHALIDGDPAVIGVDLDTSAASFHGILDDIAVTTSPVVVWGRDAKILSSSAVRPLPVLGRVSVPSTVRTGLALLPRDADGLVRRHRRSFTVEGSVDGVEQLPSLPWAVLDAYRHERAIRAPAPATPQVLNFFADTYQFPRLRARHVLEAAQGQGWTVDSPIRGRVVLLGATYRAAREEYLTPAGTMFGVMLLAQALESDLSGGGVQTVNHVLMLILEIACGVALVYVHHRHHERPALAFALNLLMLPVLAGLGSLLAFSAFAYWANFIPILAAVTIHQVANHLREARRCREALALVVAERHGAVARSRERT